MLRAKTESRVSPTVIVPPVVCLSTVLSSHASERVNTTEDNDFLPTRLRRLLKSCTLLSVCVCSNIDVAAKRQYKERLLRRLLSSFSSRL